MEQLRKSAAKEYLERTRNGQKSIIVLALLAKKHEVSARTILRWVKKRKASDKMTPD